MWRSSRSVPASDRKSNRGEVVEITRRVEVLVERRTCTIALHGGLPAADDPRCPLCGQALLPAAEETQALE